MTWTQASEAVISDAELDQVFDAMVAQLPEVDASGFPVVEGLRSIKYDLTYDGAGLMSYVFAADPVEAIAKGRREFEIAEDVDVTATRMVESRTGHHGGRAATGFAIRPEGLTATT